MAANDKNDRAAFRAKQFRDFYKAKWSDTPTKFQTVDDIVCGLLKSNGDEMKLEEIYHAFFSKEGKQYDNDSMRASVKESLKKLCEKGQVANTRYGYYRAL